MADLDVRRDGGALWITLARPEVGNALTPDQRDAPIFGRRRDPELTGR